MADPELASCNHPCRRAIYIRDARRPRPTAGTIVHVIGGTMNRAIAAAATAVLAATLVACGGSGGDVKSPFGKTPPIDSSTAATPSSPSPSSTELPLHGKLGDTFLLRGLDYTSQANVTLTQWLDLAHASIGYFEPGPDQRLVAAKFKVESNGSGPYSSPGYMEARVFDSAGKPYVGTPSVIKEGDTLPNTMNLQPGENATGWVVFKVPKDAKITDVCYQMDTTGISYDREATWKLG
jgi:hypothetical protein